MKYFFCCLLALPALIGRVSAETDRPNFVFLVSEDNSIHYMQLYGYGVATPNIEALASDGLVFNNAFSCSPVCSVARSTLATGMYAPRGGFQYHRKSAPASLPSGFQPWSSTLRQGGYYCTNRRKTDYNFVHKIRDLWDDSSAQAGWRKRPTPNTPFFHMQSFAQSHEGSLHFPRNVMAKEQTTTSLDEVTLAPYHPDTTTFRYTHARYLDRIRIIDRQIGQVVDSLRTDGLLDTTFVFYFGDHGGVLPRGKGYAYESGLHVPLVVRIPKRFQHLVDHKPGSRLDGFVSFVDFGPTVLHLAGVDIPSLMDGVPFLGDGVSAAQLAARDEAFGHADRFDEKYDLVRTLRKGRFTYIRNFQAYYPDGLQNNYRYRMLAYQEWRTLFQKGKLNVAQKQFHERRPAEQLFDVETDPHQVHNLAGEPAHARVLTDLRARLQQKLRDINDLSFYPENEMVQAALSRPVAFGKGHAEEIRRLADISDLALQSFDKAGPMLGKAMTSTNPWERYWACMTAAVHGKPARALVPAATELLDDDHLMVRVRAAEFLGSIRAADPMPTLYEVLNSATTEQELMLAFNTVVYLRDVLGYTFDVSRLKLKFHGGEVHRRIDYLNGNIAKGVSSRPARAKKTATEKVSYRSFCRREGWLMNLDSNPCISQP